MTSGWPGIWEEHEALGPVRVLTTRRRAVLVPDQIRDCTCFIYVSKKGAMKPAGTAFFFSVHLGETGQVAPFLVTALHVIAGAQEEGHREVYVRVNTADGGFEYLKVDVSAWERPDQSDRAVDVAVTPWPYGMAHFDFKWVERSSCVTPEVIEEESIGVGDGIFLPGLFVNHYGRRRNIPIIRVGNIAAMPSEPVDTKRLGAMDAYLVESRSLGGLSGSPVFVYLGTARQDRNANVYTRPIGSRMWYLLGVMHGHWERRVSDEDEGITGGLPPEYVNMGIAVVTPIAAVLDLLERGPLRMAIDEKARQVEEQQKAEAPVMDTVAAGQSEEGEFERFEDLTRRVLSIPKEEIDNERKAKES